MSAAVKADNEEKIWEKAWTTSDLKNNATSWTLAGDAGLLLKLKEFSDNLFSKTIAIQKELQQLSYQEKQSHVKFQNAMSNFLILENSQFMENRVYEDDATQLKAEEPEIEKTKEEKEQELLANMNESLKLGMSIIDNYFDKLTAKESMNADDLDEYDDEDDIKDDEKSKNIIIYETKDPYVLRSLPYLIGSKYYMENDHVGLKDLDSEEEEEEEEDEELVDEKNETSESEYEDDSDLLSDAKSNASNINKDNSAPISANAEIINKVDKSKPKKQKQDLFDSFSEEEEDAFDLFNSNKNKLKKGNLFDDDDDEEDDVNEGDDDVKKVKEPSKLVDETRDDDKFSNNSDNDENENERAKPEPVKKPLDFASELSKKLSQKFTPKSTEDENKDDEETPKLPPKPTEKKPTKSLFASDPEQEDQDDLFASKASVPSKTAATKANIVIPKPQTKNLFDDSSDSEKSESDDLFSSKKAPKISVFEENSNTDKNTVTISTTEPKEVLPVAPPSKEPQKAEKKKISIFDDDDNDDDDDSFGIFASTKKNVTTKTALSDTAPPVPPPKPSASSKPKPSLFDDENDEDDLFSTLNKKPTIQPNTKPAETQPASNKKSLFESLSEEDDILSPKKTTSEVKKTPPPPLPTKAVEPPLQPSTVEAPPPPLVSQTSNKKSLFDSEEDLISSFGKDKPPPVIDQKIIKPEANKKSLFDSDDDDDAENDFLKSTSSSNPLSKDLADKTLNKAPPKVESNKKSLFSDEDDDSSVDIFASKKTEEKTSTIKKTTSSEANKKSLFDSLNDEDDDLFKSSNEKDKKLQDSNEKPIVKEAETVSTNPPSNEPSNETESAPEKKATKKIPAGKNLLFDPSALKSSALFKKIAVNKDTDSEEEEKATVVEEDSKKVASLKEDSTEVSKKLSNQNDDISSYFESVSQIKTGNETKKAKQTESESTAISNEKEFDGFQVQVDRSFTESNLKDIQKDRIKAGRKRTPATKRRIDINIASEESNLFSNDLDVLATKKENETEVKKTDQVKPVIVESKALFDSPPEEIKKPMAEEKRIVKEEIVSKKKELNSIFDNLENSEDMDDIFKIEKKSTLPPSLSNTKTKESVDKEIKPKVDEVKEKEKDKKKALDSIFDNLDDDSMDIFNMQKKPKEVVKKPLDNLFEDDDIFSDSLLNTNKKKEASKTLPAQFKTTGSNSKETKGSNMFTKLDNDDDFDIFKEMPKKQVKPKDYDPLNFFE